MGSYTDLDFIIPTSVHRSSDVPKTWIYVDNIKMGTDIIDHLRAHLPHKSLYGLIRPYNAVLDPDYRHKAMKCFKSSEIRILVCTDAAGMVSFTPCKFEHVNT
jgi:superfamily II DNA helicase RecQ